MHFSCTHTLTIVLQFAGADCYSTNACTCALKPQCTHVTFAASKPICAELTFCMHSTNAAQNSIHFTQYLFCHRFFPLLINNSVSTNTLTVFINMTFRLSEHGIKQKIKAQGAVWVAQQQFWLFGTAIYYDGTNIGRREAERDCRHYFNTIDKQLLTRREYNAGNRLQRLVFIETGRERCNTHIHFFIKGTHLKQYRHIKHTAEQNWCRHIHKASDCEVLDNIGLTHERKGYGWKEFDSLDSEVLYTQCCHIHTS